MKYLTLATLILLASTIYAQCPNCPSPQRSPEVAPALPTITQSIVETQLPMFARLALRAEGRKDAREVRQTSRAASLARYPAIGSTLSYGSTGTPQSASSTGTLTYLFGVSGGSSGTVTGGSSGVLASPKCECNCPACICK